MKKSLLALAVSLAAVSGAHAAWDAEAGVSALNGNGEMLLVGWDDVNKVSVYQDTGYKYYDFQGFTNANYTASINLSSVFTSTFANSSASSLHWTLFVASNGLNSDPNGVNVAFTSNAGAAAVAQVDFTAAGNLGGAALSIAANINNAPASAGNVGGSTNYALNNSILGTAANGLYAGDDANFGNKVHLASPIDVTAGFGTALNFYGTDGSDNDGIQTALSTWKLNLSAGTLTYGTVSSVPVPAAAWLMGSALVGLGSIARRRRA